MPRSYFPVLRGKQYELLALRDLAETIKVEKKIRPVIEPLSVQATASALDRFTETSMPFCLIVNPKIGALSSLGLKAFYQQLVQPYLEQDDLFLPTLYIDGQTTSSDLAEFIAIYQGQRAFFLTDEPRTAVTHAVQAASPSLVLLAHGTVAKPTKDLFAADVSVDITDPFRRRSRNKDYAATPDEFFSDQHLRTPNADFGHFGDYSIIGERYSIEGGPAYCVAIHMIYAQPPPEQILRVRHFLSDSNETPADPGGKFSQAVAKLAADWPQLADVNHTAAATRFLEMNVQQLYPGLGKVKELSLKHHFELMHKLL